LNVSSPTKYEIILDPEKYIVSKTDTKGVIEYGNDYFIEISGYSESEILGQPHSIIRHPSMPKIIFKMMWERINQGKNIMALVKNMAKDGRFYWVVTDFKSKKDTTNKIISHIAFRKAAPREAINAIEPIYKNLLEIEKTDGIEASEKYFQSYLKDKDISYDDFINKLIEGSNAIKVFFQTIKKIFS